MNRRPCPDMMDEPAAPPETPEMAETELAVELGERHRAILARLAEIGMALAETLLEQAEAAGVAEAGAAYAKVAQAVRRTIALERQIAEDLGRRRAGLATKRVERREAARGDRVNAKTNEVHDEIVSAICEEHDEVKEPGVADRLIERAEALLEADDYAGYLDRPVGETIARLCRDLGLDPDWCVKTAAGWAVKFRAPYLDSTGEILPWPLSAESWNPEVSPRPSGASKDAHGPENDPPRGEALPAGATGPPA